MVTLDESSVRDRLRPYLPRLTLNWLATDPTALHQTVDGSVVFVDISGFTKLSEKLARFGRIGAEEMADAINGCFADLLAVAYEDDGSLLKFGGDALLLLFDGGAPHEHAARAARAAAGMRQRLRTVGKLETSGGRVNLRMSVGVHSGRFDFFLVGGSHRELLVAGPAATEVVRMEGTADAGEIVISPNMAGCLPARSVGEPKGAGFFLRSAPKGEAPAQTWVLPDLDDEALRGCVPLATREHLLAGAGEPEHRQVAVAFLHFDGTDELLAAEGPQVVAQELDQLVRDTQAAVDEFGVCFLGSDADADGGKLILAAGAPRAMGDDEQRMLLALRRIADGDRRIPVRIGVNHGGVFSGDVGPRFRRTYTVMGDTVNLAARLMAKAPPGQIYATASVLDRSPTRFALTELEPFMVKGKAKPIEAWSVGAPVAAKAQQRIGDDHPIVGRDEELRLLSSLLASALASDAQLVEIVGESGIGKSRLVHELLDGSSLRTVGAIGEAYTSSTPYVAWRDALRDLLALQWEDPSEVVAARLTEVIQEVDPELLPWAPLIATAADAEMPPTHEVRDLAPDFVRPKLHEVVLRFLRATRTEPTLFVFEDAHLMDEPSAELLAAVATTPPFDRPWLFIAIRRDVDTGFVAPDAPNLQRLSPPVLDTQSATALAEAATDDAPLPGHLLARAVERAAGNPQLLLDLVVAASSGDGVLPESVEAAATVRIDALATDDRTLLRRASVLGLAFHPRFLVDVLDEGTAEPDDTTWERLAEFLEQDSGGYLRFRRAVVRDAAYAGLPFRVRRRLHGVVGLRMEGDLPDPEGEAGILSLHFFLAADYQRAWRYATIAGNRALAIFANVEAARFYARAVESARKVGAPDDELLDLHEAAGEALWRARLYAEARKANADARARARARDDAVRLARLMMKRSLIEEKMGRLSQALAWLTRARRRLEGLTSTEALQVAAEVDARYASGLQAQGRNRDALRMARRAIEEGEAAGSARALGDAENMLAAALAILGQPGAVDHWQRALDHFERSDNLPGQGLVLGNLGVGAYFEGRWADAVELHSRALEISERLGDPVGAANDRANIAEILVDQGDLQTAEELLVQTARVWRATGEHYAYGFVLLQLARIAAMTGRIDEARELMERAREEYTLVGAPGQVLEVDARDAECLVLAGDARGALERCAAVEARLEVDEGVNVLTPLLERVRGYAYLQLGDLELARTHLERGIAAARDRGADHDVALSMQAMARLVRIERGSSDSLEAESGEILARLGIRAVPAVPLSRRDDLT